MKPKEKAIELYKKYEKYFPEQYKTYQTHLKCIDCALIAVDEIIEATSIKYEYRNAEIFYAGKKPMQYWLDVKKEIEKL